MSLPSLDLTYVKGNADLKAAPGKPLVIECWATVRIMSRVLGIGDGDADERCIDIQWCPPCRASIPHLTSMAKKFTNVLFVGVTSERMYMHLLCDC